MFRLTALDEECSVSTMREPSIESPRGGLEPPRPYEHKILNPASLVPQVSFLTGFSASLPNPVATRVATRSCGMNSGILAGPVPGRSACVPLRQPNRDTCFRCFAGVFYERLSRFPRSSVFLFLSQKDRLTAGLATDSLGCPITVVLCDFPKAVPSLLRRLHPGDVFSASPARDTP
jgi:hypothetical protein